LPDIEEVQQQEVRAGYMLTHMHEPKDLRARYMHGRLHLH
jgi:hypothetical protein